MFKRLLFGFDKWLCNIQEKKYINELFNHYIMYFESKYNKRKVSDIKEITKLIRSKYIEKINAKESSLSYEKFIIKDRINRHNDLSLMPFVSLYIPMLASYGFTYFALRNNVSIPINLTALTIFTYTLLFMTFYYTIYELNLSWKSRSRRNFYLICLEVLEELSVSNNKPKNENNNCLSTLNNCIDEVAITEESKGRYIVKVTDGDKESTFKIKVNKSSF
jgi:hypothetical protein